MTLPSWMKAPAFARYLSTDVYGDCKWHFDKPTLSGGIWWGPKGTQSVYAGHRPFYKDGPKVESKPISEVNKMSDEKEEIAPEVPSEKCIHDAIWFLRDYQEAMVGNSRPEDAMDDEQDRMLWDAIERTIAALQSYEARSKHLTSQSHD